MLKARLHGSLGRALSDAGVNDASLRRRIASSEDALTSSVIGRLPYLPHPLGWELLGRAAVPVSEGARWPATPPAPPAWQFWPTLAPGQDDDRDRVIPDVLVTGWGGTLVLEAKHWGRQRGIQWGEQLRAVLGEGHAGRVVLVALGGRRAAPTWPPRIAEWPRLSRGASR